MTLSQRIWVTFRNLKKQENIWSICSLHCTQRWPFFIAAFLSLNNLWQLNAEKEIQQPVQGKPLLPNAGICFSCRWQGLLGSGGLWEQCHLVVLWSLSRASPGRLLNGSWRDGLLEGCTPGTWDSEFDGKGLSETIAWVAPRSLPGSRPRCLSLEPFSGSHHAAEACEG